MNVTNRQEFLQTLIYKTIFGATLCFLLTELFFGTRLFFEGYPSYESMIISDWLINYEGGFVRRGLIGQFLLELYKVIPHPIAYTILTIYFSSLVVLLRIIYHIFKNNGWSLFIAIFPVCISISFLGVRRDYLMLILCYYVLKLYSRYIQTHRNSLLIWANIISSLAILMHEVYFFFTIPILIFFTITSLGHLSLKTMAKSLLLWSPPIITMFAVCINKGDISTAQIIWDSWKPCFTAYPLSDTLPQMGSAVEWLSYNTSYAIPFHINKFWLYEFIPGIPSWPFNTYVIVCIFIIMTRLNSINIQFWPIQSIDYVKLGSILIIQLVFLFPMFGFLSCDFSRVIMYWVLSSIFTYHWLQKTLKIPTFLKQKLKKLLYTVDRIPLFSNKWIFLIILLSLPIASYNGANIFSCFAFIPGGWRQSFWSLIYEYLNITQ